jgi:hypothetical protein
MIVISVPTGKITDEDGNVTPEYGNFFDQNTQQMQQSLSNEGFWIPSVSSASNSVMPPTSGGQLAQVAASFGQQNGANAGTIVYDPNTNQLKVLLSDGMFHAITTS